MHNPTQWTRIDMIGPRLATLPTELLNKIFRELTRSRSTRTIQRFMRGLSQRLWTSHIMYEGPRRAFVGASARAYRARRDRLGERETQRGNALAMSILSLPSWDPVAPNLHDTGYAADYSASAFGGY